QGSTVVDSWDSSMGVYSLLDDGIILRKKTPIKNDADYAVNSSLQTLVKWLDNNSGQLPDEVIDMAAVYLIDATSIMIFNGKLNRDDAPQYLDNAIKGVYKKLEGYGYVTNVY
ncbi:MAG TPA: hypothetical protein VFD23_07275, partial [Clostridia bacterium]|nr:hypothetical protein [Clostridia bacterium]